LVRGTENEARVPGPGSEMFGTGEMPLFRFGVRFFQILLDTDTGTFSQQQFSHKPPQTV
jgi:hypothetical protein